MVFKIFYSWQSDLSSSQNRSFIEDALKKAVKKIKNDSIDIEPVIDRDTKGEAGSPDIVQTIFAKIEKSDIFLCDVSIINKAENHCPKPTPNPNVLVELDYALKTLGENHIIMVINEAYGCTKNLPFDLDHRRVLKYNFNKNEKTNTEKSRKCKEELVRDLTNAVNIIVSQFIPQSLLEDLRLNDDKVRHSRLRFKNAIKCAIEKVEPNLVLPSFIDQYQSIEDEYEKFFVVFNGTDYFWHVDNQIKLIEYSKKVTSLLDSLINDSEIKNQLFAPVINNKLITEKKIEIPSIVTPLIEQDYPDVLDIYFRILTILDSKTYLWKKTFENDFINGFGEQTIVNEINEKKKYIEKLEEIRPQILNWSFLKKN